MGRRKRSDVNRTANFTKGDEDQPTKKPRIPSGKENRPLVTASQMEGHSGRQLTDIITSPHHGRIREGQRCLICGGCKAHHRLSKDLYSGS